MKKVGEFTLLRWLSLGLVIAAVVLTVFQLVVYSRLRSSFSPGTKIAGVDVTGLDQDQAASRLTRAYSIPVELRYNNNIIQVKPATLGFKLDLSAMMAAADQARVALPFWSSFFEYLFNQLPPSQEVPLKVKIDEAVMQDYLQKEIAARYDQAPAPYVPIPGSVNFQSGTSGTSLNIGRAVIAITSALKSPVARVVNLPLDEEASSRPSFTNLKILLEQIVADNNFDGLIEIYLKDLQSGEDMQLAYQNGEILKPDIAFTAASIIKIPIMVEVYKVIEGPANAEISTLLEKMILNSDNDAADSLMKLTMDPNLGPLMLTDALKQMGFENTYLAGMFYYGAPLLRRITTPANSRTDLNTDPDPYSETTPTEAGDILDDIYQCAQNGGGTFGAVFPGKITQNECKSILALLFQNRNSQLLEIGLPDGTQMGHKHGWTSGSDGLVHQYGDAAIVYSPGGNYILTVFIYHPVQIIDYTATRMYADISRAVYNYFNLTNQ